MQFIFYSIGTDVATIDNRTHQNWCISPNSFTVQGKKFVLRRNKDRETVTQLLWIKMLPFNYQLSTRKVTWSCYQITIESIFYFIWIVVILTNYLMLLFYIISSIGSFPYGVCNWSIVSTECHPSSLLKLRESVKWMVSTISENRCLKKMRQNFFALNWKTSRTLNFILRLFKVLYYKLERTMLWISIGLSGRKTKIHVISWSMVRITRAEAPATQQASISWQGLWF